MKKRERGPPPVKKKTWFFGMVLVASFASSSAFADALPPGFTDGLCKSVIEASKFDYEKKLGEIETKNDWINEKNDEFHKLEDKLQKEEFEQYKPVWDALHSLTQQDVDLINAYLQGSGTFSIVKATLLAKIEPILNKWNTQHPEKAAAIEISVGWNDRELNLFAKYAINCDFMTDNTCYLDAKFDDLLFTRERPANVADINEDMGVHLQAYAWSRTKASLGYDLSALTEIPTMRNFCVKELNIPAACFSTSEPVPSPAAISESVKKQSSDSIPSASPALSSSSSASSAK